MRLDTGAVFFYMEKVTFIIDGGFFTKQYKKIYKKFPTAEDVEKYVWKVFKCLKLFSAYPIEIYRIFYYDCSPLHLRNLVEEKIVQKPQSMEKNDLQKICETFEKQYKVIKKFHDRMKRKSFFALCMGQLRFQGWDN